LSPPKVASPPEPEVLRTGLSTRTYKINANGSDALLKFGKHRGRTVSWLVDHEPDYLRWMLRPQDMAVKSADFDEALLDVVRHQLKRVDK
jgi:hypothetical protein